MRNRAAVDWWAKKTTCLTIVNGLHTYQMCEAINPSTRGTCITPSAPEVLFIPLTSRTNRNTISCRPHMTASI